MSKQITIIDGQGGSLGRTLIEAIKRRFSSVEILAIGTNSLATSAMIQAGAHAIATGENPVIVAARSADLIIGPIGIIIADALHGEITAEMATAICQSKAHKILIPVSRCNTTVVGRQGHSLTELITQALEEIANFLD